MYPGFLSSIYLPFDVFFSSYSVVARRMDQAVNCRIPMKSTEAYIQNNFHLGILTSVQHIYMYLCTYVVNFRTMYCLRHNGNLRQCNIPLTRCKPDIDGGTYTITGSLILIFYPTL